MRKLTALLWLALALLRSSGFALRHERLPAGRAKIRVLRAVARGRKFVPLPALLRFLQLSPSRFHAWRRLELACALDDQSSCPHTSPHRLTSSEVRAIVQRGQSGRNILRANDLDLALEASRRKSLILFDLCPS